MSSVEISVRFPSKTFFTCISPPTTVIWQHLWTEMPLQSYKIQVGYCESQYSPRLRRALLRRQPPTKQLTCAWRPGYWHINNFKHLRTAVVQSGFDSVTSKMLKDPRGITKPYALVIGLKTLILARPWNGLWTSCSPFCHGLVKRDHLDPSFVPQGKMQARKWTPGLPSFPRPY